MGDAAGLDDRVVATIFKGDCEATVFKLNNAGFAETIVPVA